MKFILIMCTLGRSEEPKRFLDSIALQTYKNIKVIIVDQNKDKRISSMLDNYINKFEICYLKSKETGLSKARNKALSYIEEGVIAFPDDDCWYPSNLLADINNVFTIYKDIHGLCIKRTENDLSEIENKTTITLSKFNLWGRASSICLFLTSNTVSITGCFDEQLGVGANTLWGAGEDTDFILRALRKKRKLLHMPSLKVYHADPVNCLKCEEDISRAKSYSRGLGRVILKNSLPWWMFLGSIILSIFRTLKAIFTFNFKTARWHWVLLSGKLEAFQKRNCTNHK